jgi:hypothetical protein
MPDAVEDWMSLRAELRRAEEATHPDITDPHGRTWQWKDGDLYTHDATLAVPRDMIETSNLPPVGLADRNPNYAGLCAVCRHTVTEEPTP